MRLVLTALLVASLLGVGLAARDPVKAEAEACQHAITADCLLDLGTALALRSEQHRTDSQLPTRLALAGRLADAETIAALQARDRGWEPARAAEWAAWTVADHRLLRDLRTGLDLEAALARTPAANGSSLDLVGSALLGRDPYGGLNLASSPAPTTTDRALVADFAARIVAWVEESSPRARPSDLKDAADLYAALGDIEGTRAVLRAMTERGLEAVITETIIAVAGWDEARQVPHLSDEERVSRLWRAARAVDDPVRATALLKEGFDLAAARAPWSDSDGMLEVVETASSLGLPEARPLADRLAVLAAASESPWRVFEQVDAAAALLAAGAPRSEVLAGLDRAEALFPSDPDEVVVVGLVAGPMRWEGSGLADTARAEIAEVAARAGDLDRATRMLGAMEEPVWGWAGLALEPMSLSARDELLAMAWATLPEDDARYVAGQFARRAAWLDQSEAELAWALALVRPLAEDGGGGRHGQAVAEATAHVAHRAGDRALEETAVKGLALRALADRNASALVQAGILFAEISEAD